MAIVYNVEGAEAYVDLLQAQREATIQRLRDCVEEFKEELESGKLSAHFASPNATEMTELHHWTIIFHANVDDIAEMTPIIQRARRFSEDALHYHPPSSDCFDHADLGWFSSDIHIHVHLTGQKCKVVQVGSKTKQIPIYEVQCD